MFVKICGITRDIDLQAVVAAGADAVGFIAYPKSPRYITPDAIRALNLPDDLMKVAVFVNASLEEIQSYISVGVTTIQLHGEESAEFLEEVRKLDGVREVWKAVRVRSEDDIRAVASYPADRILLDSYSDKGHGGTGETMDWSIAQLAVKDLAQPVILSGGLSPDNITEAIREVSPWGVDLSSGVEESPGIKRHDLIQRFLSLVKGAGN